MKKVGVLGLCFFLLTACSFIETNTLANSIKKDFQSQLDGNISALASLGFDVDELDVDVKPVVKDVTVVHVEGNKYVGIAEIEIASYTFKQSLNIVSDGTSYYWEVGSY